MNYKINKYPDGTSYVTIDDIKDESPEITFRVNTYEDLWHLAQLCEVCVYNRLEPIITIPCLLDGQADRRFDIKQSSGLYMVTQLLEQFETITFKIFHPHNPEVVEASIRKSIILDNTDFITKVLDNLVVEKFGEKYDSFQKQSFSSNLILMSSDAGGFKPLMKLCDNINWRGDVYSASKSRNYYAVGGAKLIQVVDREDFEGKDILIVDDISVYGGTFKGLSKILRDKNCGKLYLTVSHITVQNLGDDPVTNYFDKVFTTNSKFDNYFSPNSKGEATQPKNLEIIKLF